MVLFIQLIIETFSEIKIVILVSISKHFESFECYLLGIKVGSVCQYICIYISFIKLLHYDFPVSNTFNLSQKNR